MQHVLSVLKEIDRPAFDVLASKFRQYASCVGLLDTGYFRKRTPTALREDRSKLRAYSPTDEGDDDSTISFRDDEMVNHFARILKAKFLKSIADNVLELEASTIQSEDLSNPSL